MQTHARGGGIGSRHIDRAFGYGNADLAAAPANLELRADHANLDVIDRDREGPSGIASDGEIGVPADDRRVTHASRDFEAQLRFGTEHDASAIRQRGLAHFSDLRRHLCGPVQERQQVERESQPHDHCDGSRADRDGCASAALAAR